jgi:hypothetical protein
MSASTPRQHLTRLSCLMSALWLVHIDGNQRAINQDHKDDDRNILPPLLLCSQNQLSCMMTSVVVEETNASWRRTSDYCFSLLPSISVWFTHPLYLPVTFPSLLRATFSLRCSPYSCWLTQGTSHSSCCSCYIEYIFLPCFAFPSALKTVAAKFWQWLSDYLVSLPRIQLK